MRKRFLAGVLLIVVPFILVSTLEMAAFQRSAGAFERAAHHARRQLALIGDVKESVLQVPLSLHEYLGGNVAKLNEFAIVSGRAHRQVGRLALALDRAEQERTYARLNSAWLEAAPTPRRRSISGWTRPATTGSTGISGWWVGASPTSQMCSTVSTTRPSPMSITSSPAPKRRAIASGRPSCC